MYRCFAALAYVFAAMLLSFAFKWLNATFLYISYRLAVALIGCNANWKKASLELIGRLR